jgi:ribosomal protein L1
LSAVRSSSRVYAQLLRTLKLALTLLQVVSGKIQATTFLCAPDLIRTITPRLGRILGPRGLMPSDRRGTVTEDFAGYMRRLNSSEEWKGDKRGTIRMPIAKVRCPLARSAFLLICMLLDGLAHVRR